MELYQINIPPSRSWIPWLYYSSDCMSYATAANCRLRSQVVGEYIKARWLSHALLWGIHWNTGGLLHRMWGKLLWGGREECVLSFLRDPLCLLRHCSQQLALDDLPYRFNSRNTCAWSTRWPCILWKWQRPRPRPKALINFAWSSPVRSPWRWSLSIKLIFTSWKPQEEMEATASVAATKPD